MINIFQNELETVQEIHVATAQRYAAAAYRDGLCESTIRDLASLASWGRHQQNVERDLHRWMPDIYDSQLAMHGTSIEVYNPDTAKIEQMEIPILLASDVLNALWRKSDPKLWDTCIGTTASKCGEYWRFAEEWASTHPVLQLFGCIMFSWFHPKLLGGLESFWNLSHLEASGKGWKNARYQSLGQRFNLTTKNPPLFQIYDI